MGQKSGMQLLLLPGDRLLCVCTRVRSLSVCRMDL